MSLATVAFLSMGRTLFTGIVNLLDSLSVAIPLRKVTALPPTTINQLIYILPGRVGLHEPPPFHDEMLKGSALCRRFNASSLGERLVHSNTKTMRGRPDDID